MNATRTMPRLMKLVALLASLMAAALALQGCATPTSLSAQVVSHARWDAGRQPGSFSFDRLPSQQDAPAQQQALEAAALPALRHAGFQPAASGSDAVYTVQIGARARVEQQRWSRLDPFWDPYWGATWGPGSPWRRGPFAGPPGMPPGWVAPPPPPPRARMQVDVMVRERASGQVLYEAHARYDRPGNVDNRLWPALFDAALQRFPTPLPEAVDIEVPLPAEGP